MKLSKHSHLIFCTLPIVFPYQSILFIIQVLNLLVFIPLLNCICLLLSMFVHYIVKGMEQFWYKGENT